MEKELTIAADIILSGSIGTCLTGAGISVDSGIPPFSGNEGLWEKYDPEEYVSISGFMRNPEKVWNLYAELAQMLHESKPNPGHKSLAELESEGYINGIVTQNIDGLHTRAGSNKVVEYHGGSDRAVCMICRKTYQLNEEKLKDIPPRCDCGEILKPDIVFYGEQIPKYAAMESVAMTQGASFILVVGTASIVFPANQLPMIVRSSGGKIIEFNIEPTPLTEIADVTVFGSSSETLPKLVKILRSKKEQV